MGPFSIALAGLSPPYAAAFRAWAASQGSETIAFAEEEPSALADADLSLCVAELGGDRRACLQRLRSLRKLTPPCPIVVLARGIRVDTAVALMHEGAADVIELPAAPADVVARAALRAMDTSSRADAELVGQSPAIQALRREIHTLARLRSTVLLVGETGVGKGLVARLVHELSDRSDQPFVYVDCASLAGSAIDSELFGHERGAFAGAMGRRAGRFEQAGAGTIFLDEIGGLELPLQAKLLRVLHDRTYERIGGARALHMDARVIAATNGNLVDQVRQGSFRSDLYFRLRVFELRIPPLRERASDLPLLVRHGFGELAQRLSVTVPEVSEAFYAALMQHDWPGNVRELYNVLERLMLTCEDGRLDEHCVEQLLPLGRPARVDAARCPPLATCTEADAVEKQRIAAALLATGGNIARTARRLDLPRSTLRYRIKRHALSSLIPDD